jgi:hypothetical protein
MAEDLKPSSASAAAEHAPARPGPTARAPEPAPVYPKRFRAAYFALAVILGAAVGTFVLFAGGRAGGGPAWSTWEPTAKGEERAWQIADHVSARYRHPSGKKLVEVASSPPVVQIAGASGQREQLPISVIFVRGRTSDFSDAQAKQVRGDETLMFALCGGGERCAMDEGAPTAERGTLLRREVLELALYAYKYVDDIDVVLALLPPAQATDQQGQAAALQRVVYFRKQDLNRVLDIPLDRLLPGRPTLQMSPRVSQMVDSLVVSRQFQYSFEPGQQGDALLILSPLSG